MSMAATAFKLAALVCPDADGHGDAADALLRQQCRQWQAQGWRLAGLLQQRQSAAAGGGVPSMQLVDVQTGRVFGISQALGPQACGCCLDPGGVAEASAVLRQALLDRPDLVLINRFGALEAAGAGFAQELARLVEHDIPALMVVMPKYLPAWRAFTGGRGQELAVTSEALHAWLRGLAGLRESV